MEQKNQVMEKSPAFQWYPRDILSSSRVQMMSLVEECVYRRLIDYCWLNGSIPADTKLACKLVGKRASLVTTKAALSLFTPHPEDPTKLIHDRLEKERSKQAKTRKKRQEAANTRWEKERQNEEKADANADANALQVECPSSSSSSSTAVVLVSDSIKRQEFPTPERVKAYAASAPVPISEACALAFHDTQEASGWITKHGHPIADWRAALRRYASHWNENEKGKYQSAGKITNGTKKPTLEDLMGGRKASITKATYEETETEQEHEQPPF